MTPAACRSAFIAGSCLMLLPSIAGAEGGQTQLGEEVRWVFAGFLYAFVVSEIASRAAKLLNNWKDHEESRWGKLLYLALALSIVLTSWLGWSFAVRGGYYPKLEKVIQPATFVSVIEIGLLICYYSMVTALDIDDRKAPASAKKMLFWSWVIFAGYAFWDVVVMLALYRGFVWSHWVPAAASFLCWAILFLVWRGLRHRADTPRMLRYAGAGAIVLIIAFRLVKYALVVEEGYWTAAWLTFAAASLWLFAVPVIDERKWPC